MGFALWGYTHARITLCSVLECGLGQGHPSLSSVRAREGRILGQKSWEPYVLPQGNIPVSPKHLLGSVLGTGLWSLRNKQCPKETPPGEGWKANLSPGGDFPVQTGRVHAWDESNLTCFLAHHPNRTQPSSSSTDTCAELSGFPVTSEGSGSNQESIVLGYM